MQHMTHCPKWPCPSEQFPSSASVEYISITQGENGYINKKQIVKKTKFNVRLVFDPHPTFNMRPAFNPVLNSDSFSPPPNVNSLQDITDRSMEPKGGAVSCTISVSVVLFCRVADCSSQIGQALQMDPALPRVPQQTPPFGSPPIYCPCMYQMPKGWDLLLSGVPSCHDDVSSLYCLISCTTPSSPSSGMYIHSFYDLLALNVF